MFADSLPQQSYNNKKMHASFDMDGYQPLPVAYQLRGSILRRLKSGLPVLPAIDGREETKADVIRALLSGAHPYLVSEEGTGKTRLARSLTGLLPPIPFIAGCPYHDDPKWPKDLLCPRCRASKDPVQEFGIDFIPGARRFSRIQGNEYTNEAKLLGLKDIQAIAHGKSPQDPEVFTGTGVFKANRGILFVDEMPAIRTKVQVLFHPILEEKKAILEEYNWEHPLDLVLVATGNPKGYSHVNEIPRPLLDRLELIYMALPEETVEREIILKESFRTKMTGDNHQEDEQTGYPTLQDIARTAAVPWWIMDVVNKAVRYSRKCPHVENKVSIRATTRSLEHTYASVEIEQGMVAGLRQAYYGMRLALRGRLELRADLVDFDDPGKTAQLTDGLIADFIWNVFEDIKDQPLSLHDTDWKKLGTELDSLLSGAMNLPAGRLPGAVMSRYEELKKSIDVLRKMAEDRVNMKLANETEKKLYDSVDPPLAEECNYSAMEFLANICVHLGMLDETKVGQVFLARKFKS
ncbi:MAG: AAA family ATPase [Chloroflexota bacterium]